MLLTITRRIDTPRTCKPDIFFKTSRHVIILVILEEHVERIFKTKFKGLHGDTAQILMPASKPQAYQCFSHISITFLIHLAPALSQEWVHLPLMALSWT